MFNKVSDFLQPKEGKETRAERRENARKAYRLAKKMRKDLERNPELKEKIRAGRASVEKPIT
tara:strand:- start:1937 stop:2122 length:186 start_codon:yes stop_codon:yes gene_type:complete